MPGLALSHAAHLVESAVFCTRHTSHSQLPSGFLNLSNPRKLPEEREIGAVLLLEAGTEFPKNNAETHGNSHLHYVNSLMTSLSLNVQFLLMFPIKTEKMPEIQTLHC